MKRIAIVTGATGGVGEEFVKQFIKEEIDEIWAVARNEKKLYGLSEKYGKIVKAISLDLTTLKDIERLKDLLYKEEPEVCFLVNNAGLALMGESILHNTDEVCNLVDLNCKTPVLLCNICIPYMKKGSRILNISSASAFQPNPYINLYAASKAFERSYSRALNVELRSLGIIATAVCPGWIDTDLLTKEINGIKVKFPGIVKAEEVVKLAISDSKKGRDMSICSFYVKCEHIVVKLLPHKLIMRMWMKQIRNYL